VFSHVFRSNDCQTLGAFASGKARVAIRPLGVGKGDWMDRAIAYESAQEDGYAGRPAWETLCGGEVELSRCWVGGELGEGVTLHPFISQEAVSRKGPKSITC
jgi:hypothetical protein